MAARVPVPDCRHGGDRGRAPRRGRADGRRRRVDDDRGAARSRAVEIPVRRGRAAHGRADRALRGHGRPAARRRPPGRVRRTGGARGRQRAGGAGRACDPARPRCLLPRGERGLRHRAEGAGGGEHRPGADHAGRRRRRSLERARRHGQRHRPPAGARRRGRRDARPGHRGAGARLLRARGAGADRAARAQPPGRPLPGRRASAIATRGRPTGRCSGAMRSLRACAARSSGRPRASASSCP